jgi:hypothetical protein
VDDRREAWIVWVVAALAAAPASVVLWFVGGQSWCGEEVYDTPSRSIGDTLCSTLVEPVVPWALVAALPFVFVVTGGLIALHRRDGRLFALAIALPFVFVAAAVLAALAA